jgi:hypothetical protein
MASHPELAHAQCTAVSILLCVGRHARTQQLAAQFWFKMNCVLLLCLCGLLEVMSKRKADRAFELISLGRSSYASHSAISQLLADIDAGGLPETYSRMAQYRARKEVCATVTEYGSLVTSVQVPLSKGGHADVAFQNPLAFLQYNCLHSEHYARVVQQALAAQPPSPARPWKLILYEDGVDPSDGLSKNHSRKSGVFYWAFAEYGLRALCYEQMWGCITIARYSEHQALCGKVARLFETVLGLFFNETHDIRRSGVSVCFPDGSRALILAKAGIFLADIPAIKECLDCKGHSGTMCCPICLNASQHKSAAEMPLHALSRHAVSIANTDITAFRQHTGASLRSVFRRIRNYRNQVVSGAMSPDDFELHTQVCGWNYSEANLVLNPRFQLNIPQMIMLDWAHVYVHDGLADVELGLCMKKFVTSRSRTTSFRELGEYISTFTFPKGSPNPNHLFTESANANNSKKGSFSSSGSEFLTLVPVIHRYFSRVVLPRGQHVLFVQSLLAVLHVVMLLNAVKTGTVTSDELHLAIIAHLVLFKQAYGEDLFRPKHHYSIHLPGMLLWFGFLLATFTHERKHRLVTRYGRDRRNLKAWDKSIVEEVTCHQLWELRQAFVGAHTAAQPKGRVLTTLLEIFPGVDSEDLLVLNSINCNGGAFSAGDVVSCVLDGRVQLGELLVTAAVQHGPAYCFISLWQPDPASTDEDWRNFFVSRENVAQVPLQLVDTVFTYRMSTTRTTCMVFLPFEVRPK